MSDTKSSGPVQETEWSDVPGFPGYKAARDGSAWSSRRGGWKRIKPVADADGGYLRVTLRRDGESVKMRVHRIVLIAFVGPCPGGMECCHDDGNVTNNRLDNLRWDTPKANEADKRRHGTYFNRNASGIIGSTHARASGEKNGGAKLLSSDVLQIRDRFSRGDSAVSLAAEFGVHQRTIRKIASGEKWKNLS